MKLIRFAIILATVFAAAPALAADYRLDGQFPIYPHGVLDSKESSLTPGAIAHGAALVVLLSSDSVGAVDG